MAVNLSVLSIYYNMEASEVKQISDASVCFKGVVIFTQAEYLRYKGDYTRQEEALSAQFAQLEQEQPENIFERPWIASLPEHGKRTELDRTTMAETVWYGHIEITYLFSDESGILNEPDRDC